MKGHPVLIGKLTKQKLNKFISPNSVSISIPFFDSFQFLIQFLLTIIILLSSLFRYCQLILRLHTPPSFHSFICGYYIKCIIVCIDVTWLNKHSWSALRAYSLFLQSLLFITIHWRGERRSISWPHLLYQTSLHRYHIPTCEDDCRSKTWLHLLYQTSLHRYHMHACELSVCVHPVDP